MTTQLYHFKVQTDTRWPADPVKGPVLKAVSLDGISFLGWWNRSQFDEWATSKAAVITENSDGTLDVVAPLTSTSVKRMKGLIR